jgi:hypothetical protein
VKFLAGREMPMERGCRLVRPCCVIDLPPSASPHPRRPRRRQVPRVGHLRANSTASCAIARPARGAQIVRVVQRAAVGRTDDVVNLRRVEQTLRPADATQPAVTLQHDEPDGPGAADLRPGDADTGPGRARAVTRQALGTGLA